MSFDSSINDGSPIVKRKKYKIYKTNPNAPVPLRTLDRWAAKKLVAAADEGPNTSIIKELSDNESSNSTEEDICDDNSCDEQSSDSSYNEQNNASCDGQRNNDDETDSIVSHHGSINNINDNEICDENNGVIPDVDDKDNNDILLYENSNITVDESVFNLLDFYIQHQLSKSALKDALRIQLASLPSDNRMPKTVFQLLQYVENISPHSEATKHYYCKKCLFCIGMTIEQGLKCPSCDTTKEDFNFFFEFNLEDQLKHLFEKNNLATKLTLSPISHDTDIISNITDGTEYQRVNSRENRGKYDLTLILNTDGLSLVKSASNHCWPLMYTIAELPENLRESFIIILGLWYDQDCKPNMNTFLQPFCTKLQKMYDKGFKWIHPQTKEEFSSKVIAPLFIADAPARANLQNILLYNGTYGCNICEIMTKKCKKIAGKKTLRIYPFEINPPTLRTSDRMKRQAEIRKAFEKFHCRGVKGFSILSSLPLLDLGSCVLPEYMHSVLLGVVKQYTNLLLNKRGAWSIKKYSEEIDSLMKNIQPPQSFNRLPRAITDFKFYKASEFYNWILFYCLPTLIAYLPEKYFQHLMLLVMALYDLLQGEIVVHPNLSRAQNWLDSFVEQTPKLYSDREMTYNQHQLRHLELCVRRWGPLRSISAFSWENKNGYIARSVHGTKNLGQEIVNNLNIVQGVQMLKSRIAETNSAKESRELRNYMLLTSAIDDEISENDRLLLISEGFNYENVHIYSRAKIFHEIYTSLLYKTIKTNSYTVEIKKIDGSCVYGMIKIFFDRENELYFVIEQLKVDLQDMMVHSRMQIAVKHILPVVECGVCLLIRLKDVKSIFQLVRVRNYICKRPDNSKRVVILS